MVLVTSPNFCLPIQLTQNINLLQFDIFFNTILPLKIISWPCLQPVWESPQIGALHADWHLDSGHVLSAQVSLFGLSPKPTNVLQATSNTNRSAKRSCCLTKHKSSTIKPTYAYIYCDSSNCDPFVSCTWVIMELHRRSYADHLVQANRERCGVVLVLGAIR